MTTTNAELEFEVTAEERKAFVDLWNEQQAIEKIVQADLMAAVERIPSFAQIVKSTPKDVMERQQQESRERTKKAMLDGDWQPYLENLRLQGDTYAALGVPFSAWMEITTLFRKHLTDHVVAKHAKEPERLAAILRALDRYIDYALAVIGDAYLGTKEKLIVQQQRAILELSTPVLPMRERLLILPIVGVLDTRRARQLTEQLLRAIRAHRAKVVVVDITGVPAVDSKVANHLIQTVKAAKLMGARVIVTGLSPEVAQALVALGVELGSMFTVGDLQGGLELAEELLGYRLVKIDGTAIA